MSDLHVTIKLRNNALRSRRVALGLSLVKFAEHVGISCVNYMRLECLTGSPVDTRFEAVKWTATATKLAKFHGCAEAELFPDAVMDVVEPVVEFETDAESLRDFARVAAPTTPDLALEEGEIRQAVLRSLSTLTRREEEVLRMRYGLDGNERTLDGVGDELGVSKVRARQIIEKALRKLRHPSRSRLILAATEGESPTYFDGRTMTEVTAGE